jgi:alpha-tubulin suppressor-like RCC1 family protein
MYGKQRNRCTLDHEYAKCADQAHQFRFDETGKLGHGNENGHSTPKRVEALVGLVVSMIACGSRHTAVVTSPEGNLYTW